METDELLKNDFLAELIRKVPLESPSDGFIDNVMAGLETPPVQVVEKGLYFSRIKSSLPYLVLGVIIVFVIISSDIPYLNFIHGKEYFSAMFLKVFHPFWTSMKTLVPSRFITYSLLIGVSAGFLFIIDKFFSRRFSA